MSYRNPFSPTHLLQQRIAQAALLRDSRDMTGNFFAFQRPDTNRNSTIHYSSVTTQSSYGNPTWTSVLLTHSCTHVLRASLGRRAACTRETCLHIRARISSLQRNSDLGFLNSHTRRVNWRIVQALGHASLFCLTASHGAFSGVISAMPLSGILSALVCCSSSGLHKLLRREAVRTAQAGPANAVSRVP